jgi:capsular exopolysaccharide synthesis family protein
VITSNEAQAGKTTTALNVAVSMAQAGKRVLLIDADMRHPSCARALGVDNNNGLSTVLSSADKPVTVYHDCGVLGLDLLPAGPIPPNPSELLSSAKIRSLLESFMLKYDQIIIDTPPLGLVSDALMLAAIVDGVIVVVKAEKNSRRGLLRIKESLRSVNARILGVVLNAVDFRRHHNGYYGDGHYYYKAGQAQEDIESQKEQAAGSA